MQNLSPIGAIYVTFIIKILQKINILNISSYQIPKIWKKIKKEILFHAGEAPNISKAKFLIPSNLGGGPFSGFGLLFQHSSKHFWDFYLVFIFLIFGGFRKGFWKVFWKKGPEVLEKRWQNIGCKPAHRAQVKSKSLFFLLNAHPAVLGPPEPGVDPPGLQFEFIRFYFRCPKLLT